MKHRVLIVLCIFAFAILPLFASAPQVSAGVATSLMPANPEKIEQLLIAKGVITAAMTPEQKDAAVQAYLQKKMVGGGEDKGYNPMARKQFDANETALNLNNTSSIRGRKLGNQPVDVPPSVPQFQKTTGTGKLLLIAVQFSDTPYTWTPEGQSPRTAAGPMHNQIPVPDNSYDLYVPDFNVQHYESMLFTPGGWTFPADSPRYAGEHRGSMRDYYLTQSFGKYAIDGKAFGWFTVDKPEAYYGDDNVANGGNDNLGPGSTKDLIADAVSVINAQQAINWAEYDTNGDCFIDHPLFIHAGVDQSGGGGLQGDDAIWAHSSSVYQQVSGRTKTCPKGLYIYNYTIMPEDGGVGVFAHEFGHDLGLPDEYDTIYSGRGDSVAFWSLMSSGSWVGKPAQTQPSDMSIWGRYSLGWVKAGENMGVIKVSDLTKDTLAVRLEQSERWGGPGTYNALKINLPNKTYFVNTPYSGRGEWYGGKGDEIDTTLRREVDLTGKSSASLSFAAWYDTEEDWDFAFVQVSTDGGATWKSLPVDGTVSSIVNDGYPEIKENMPGFTGNSGGWVTKTADLSAYAGQKIQIQFRYMTDWGTSYEGFFVDDIAVTADGATVFADNVETAAPGWVANGWTIETGTFSKTQYYMMELRNINKMETTLNGASIVNFDAGLSNVYQHDPYGSTGNVNEPWWFSYNPGVLLWYRDTSYTDNWTGIHPGYGYLSIVDAHPQAMLRPPLAKNGALVWNSRVQTYDSPFSLNKAYDAVLGYWGLVRNYAGLTAVPNFDDSQSYWNSKAPATSVKTPTFGFLFRVLGQAVDNSAVVIGLGHK